MLKEHQSFIDSLLGMFPWLDLHKHPVLSPILMFVIMALPVLEEYLERRKKGKTNNNENENL